MSGDVFTDEEEERIREICKEEVQKDIEERMERVQEGLEDMEINVGGYREDEGSDESNGG